MPAGFVDQLENVGIVAAAAALAGLVGMERELREKPAGFRTHMIIGGASALLVLLGDVLVGRFEASPLADQIRTDPLRILQAIVVGISFLGAGTILKLEEKNRIRYLTTAATILFSSGIGIAVALRQYYLAVGVVIVVVVITSLLNWIERRLG